MTWTILLMLKYADRFQVIKNSIKTRLRFYSDTFPATNHQEPVSGWSTANRVGVTCLEGAKCMFNNMLLLTAHRSWKDIGIQTVSTQSRSLSWFQPGQGRSDGGRRGVLNVWGRPESCSRSLVDDPVTYQAASDSAFPWIPAPRLFPT